MAAGVPTADLGPYNPFDRNYDQELHDSIAKLEPLNFPVSTWTEASLLELPLRAALWLKKTKIVLSISDTDVLSRTLNIGISRGFWIDHASCTHLQFYNFCLWLRKPEGVKARDDVYFQIRIQKKKRKRALTFSEEKREVRLNYEARITELQVQIWKLQKEEEQIQKCDDSILNDSEEKKNEIRLKNEACIDELQIQIQKLQKEQEERIQKLEEEEEKIKKWQEEDLSYREIGYRAID